MNFDEMAMQVEKAEQCAELQLKLREREGDESGSK